MIYIFLPLIEKTSIMLWFSTKNKERNKKFVLCLIKEFEHLEIKVLNDVYLKFTQRVSVFCYAKSIYKWICDITIYTWPTLMMVALMICNRLWFIFVAVMTYICYAWCFHAMNHLIICTIIYCHCQVIPYTSGPPYIK